MKVQRVIAFVLLVTGMLVVGLSAQSGQGPRFGRGPDEHFATDREDFQYLLRHRDQIERSVKNLENGVETVTESDDPQVARRIKRHVTAMYLRLEENRPIHRRDPLFAELFQHARQIELGIEETERGVRVTEQSANPHAAKLIQAHARVVSLFIENGYEEVHKIHDPSR